MFKEFTSNKKNCVLINEILIDKNTNNTGGVSIEFQYQKKWLDDIFFLTDTKNIIIQANFSLKYFIYDISENVDNFTEKMHNITDGKTKHDVYQELHDIFIIKLHLSEKFSCKKIGNIFRTQHGSSTFYYIETRELHNLQLEANYLLKQYNSCYNTTLQPFKYNDFCFELNNTVDANDISQYPLGCVYQINGYSIISHYSYYHYYARLKAFCNSIDEYIERYETSYDLLSSFNILSKLTESTLTSSFDISNISKKSSPSSTFSFASIRHNDDTYDIINNSLVSP